MDLLSIDKELNKNLKERAVLHRQRFIRIFSGRYRELLPSLIHYKGTDGLDIDFMKVELALRNGFDVVIGQNTKNRLMMLGYVKTQLSSENVIDMFSSKPLKKKDITFIIPEELIMKEYREISFQDECKTGNFVVLKNKNLNYVNDMEILDHYVKELSEIVLSRFSISMQLKISTVFMGEHGDETISQIISDLYNGSPYIKTTKLFDPEDQIFNIKNEGLAQNFQELKREYQNKISELNNMLGMNSLAVEKSSGVSDEEAKSNRGFTTSNSNIYLDARNSPLLKLSRRFQLTQPITAMYNDEVLSELTQLERKEDIQNGNDDNNTLQDSTK